MRKYQLWQLEDDYAISDFDKKEIDFATIKNFSLDFKKISTLETELASKPALLEFLDPLITGYGVHPIFNTLGQKCQQIVNVPTRVLSSEEILVYLNGYTILPQETPPHKEIIYKLACYSDDLTVEYYEKEDNCPEQHKPVSEEELVNLFLEKNDPANSDRDKHYFVTAPKISEDKKGLIFHLPKPTRAHRKWIILEEYYDYKRNAWINGDGKAVKRSKSRIELIDKKKELTLREISEKKKDFFAEGGKVTKLESAWDGKELNWMALEIHPLANTIPHPTPEERESLRDDIRLNGVYETLVLFEGKILDGRTRQGICVELDIKPKYKSLPVGADPEIYVESMGIKRRHLSRSQRAAYGVNQLLPKLEIEAKNRQRQNGIHKGDKENPAFLQDSIKGEACELVADRLKVSAKYVYDAKKIKETSPDIFEKILSGSLTITAAKKQLKPSIIKKRKVRKPFEKMYREMLQTIRDRSESNNSIKASPQVFVALNRITDIYLLWNRRNDKRVIKLLEEMRIEFDEIFGEKKERHLHLLEG